MHAYTSEAELYPWQKGRLHFMILSMAYPRVVIPSVWPRWYTLISALIAELQSLCCCGPAEDHSNSKIGFIGA